jgi:acetyl esterase/lipase
MIAPLVLGLLAHARFEPHAFGVSEKVVYRTVGKKKLLMDVYRPSDITGNVPYVIVVHGGSWIGGKREDMAPICEELARRGVGAVTIDYRLAPTYKWPAMVEDCEVAYSYLAKSGSKMGLDNRRVGVLGASAGAHLALLMAMKETEPLAQKEGAPKRLQFRGVLNLFGPTLLSEDYPMDLRDAVSKTVLGKPYASAATEVGAMSPLNFVNKACPPVFTLHGEADPLVPVMQAKRLDKALVAAGVPSTVRLIPGMGHELKIALPACALALQEGLDFLVNRLVSK